MIAVLSAYPLEVVRDVVDPRCGLPSRVKWLPTIAEIKEECEELDGRRRRLQEWQERASRRQEEPKALDAPPPAPRKTYEEIQAEFAAVGIFIGNQPKRSSETAETVRAKFNLTQEQWDALPNLPERKQQRWTGKI